MTSEKDGFPLLLQSIRIDEGDSKELNETHVRVATKYGAIDAYIRGEQENHRAPVLVTLHDIGLNRMFLEK
jgi:Ndr family